MPNVIIEKTKPALYKAKYSQWHWVKLKELGLILQMLPVNVFKTYQKLATVVSAGKGGWKISRLHWIAETGIVYDWEREYLQPTDYSCILVPAGWSQKVLQVHSLGIVTLEEELFSSRQGPPESSLYAFRISQDLHQEGKDSLAIVGYTKQNWRVGLSTIGEGTLPFFKDTAKPGEPPEPFIMPYPDLKKYS